MTINQSVEKITAQDTRNNQSQLYFNSLNEKELENLFDDVNVTSGSLSIRSSVIINVLKRTDSIINKSGLSVDSKNYVKNAISLLLGMIENMKVKDDYHYEFVAECYEPEDLSYQVELLESGDGDCEFESYREIAEAAEHEMENILTDWYEIAKNSDHYYVYEWEIASQMLDAYTDVVYQTASCVSSYIQDDLKDIEKALKRLNALVEA